MPDDKMYKLVCEKRFDKLEKALMNHIPHQINNLYWRFVGTMLPFFAALLYFILRS